MRIIFTVNTYFPLKDGVQAVTQYHAEGLAAKGHEVIVVTRKVNNTKSEEEYNGVKIVRTDIFTKHAIHRGNKKLYRELIKNKCNNADILVNVCTQIVFTDWIFSILDDIKCKKVLFMHGMIDFKWYKHNFKSFPAFMSKLWNNLRWGYYYLFVHKQMKKYNLITHLHDFDNAYLYCKNHKLDNCIVLENAADEQFFNENIKPIENLTNKYFICISNYTNIKNQEFALEAFYRSETSSFSMIFIGSNETNYLKKLKKLKNNFDIEYGIRDVRFLTNIERKEISRYLIGATAYISGSVWEAFPVTIIEAMACGISFISTNVGCVRFLPGGVIVKNIYEMIYWINAFKSDIKLCENFGATGRYYAEKNLKIELKINQLEKELCKILKTR